MGKYKPKRQRRKAVKAVRKKAAKEARNAAVKRWMRGRG